MSRPVLELQGVRVERGGARVLDVPSFRLGEAERVAVVGRNGSGKSTLLLTLMGLLPCATGRVLFRGQSASGPGEAVALRRRMALVLQEPLLFDATVFDNVATGLRLRAVPRAELGERVRTSLARFHLAHLAGRAARELSGGEARRVSLARALVVEPEVVLLDEPFSGLDLPTRHAIVDDLARVLRDGRVASILVTHDPAEARRLSDRSVELQAGRIAGSTPPAPAAVRGRAAPGDGLEAITPEVAPA